MTAAAVSVVIPVYNDAKNLERCLRSLYDHSRISFETVVVDDGSEDNPADIARKFPCQLLRFETNRGQAYARNRGVEASHSRLILFTDADCIVMKDWVRCFSDKFVELHGHFPQIAAVAGRLDSSGSYVSKAYAYTSYAYAQAGRPGFSDYLNTACAAVRKDAFLSVGGFSEDMRVNEDPDLALKLVEAGHKVFFEPSIHIFHDHGISTVRDFLAKEKRWGRQSASALDLRHSKKRLGCFSPLVRNPVTHFLLILPLAFLTAAKAVWSVEKNGLRALRYFPLIFLGKLFFRLGNFVGTLKDPRASGAGIIGKHL